MTRSSYRGSWTYRLTFSVGGVVFATTSYIAGIYAYGVESISWGNTDFGRTLARDLLGAFQSHQITFLGWMLVCGAIAGIIAHLFEKERYFREKAEQRANVDGLTDLYNHRYFQERLRAETERADRFNRNVSLIMLDIDDFKKFNDTWGHQEGDKLLKWFSNLCTRCVRGMDVVARYGGEEFVVILPEADSDVGLKVAERIRHVTDTQSCAHLGKSKRITVSAGVATYPEHGQTRHALQVNVDAALYYAKQRGKNQCFIYRSEHHKSYRVSADQVKALLAEKDIGAVEALAEAADARDEHAAGHSAAVMKISVELAESMGMTAEQVDSVRIAALLHDWAR